MSAQSLSMQNRESMKHTKEPWRIGRHKGTAILSLGGDNYIAEANTREDAERIVACVNAMEDVEHPEKWPEIQAERIKENVKLKAQRDLMLAALRFIEQMQPKDNNGREYCYASARKKVLETLLALEEHGR